MTEDFDLPRWQTQDSSSISSPTHNHPSAPYLQYPPPPPPAANQQQRLQTLQQSPTGTNQSGGGSPTSSRQPPRISQLLEQEQQQQSFAGSTPYSLSPHSTLNRSASLGGGTTSSSRNRRHHQPDDLEGAFHSDSVSGLSSPRSSGASQLQTSLYPSSVAYHQAQGGTAGGGGSSSVTSPAAESSAYSDMYYSGAQGQHTPKRSLTTHDSSTSSRGAAGRSPAQNPSLADSYAQQSQYSPTTNSSFATPYPPPPPGAYHAHSRSHSQVKGEQPMTPPMASPYAPASNTLSPSYSDSHNSSPSGQPRGSSASTPNTPFPYPQTSQSPYYNQQSEQMQVDAPQHKRRASGFKRVRDARDLRPVVNQQPAGRRMGADGTYLSVSVCD